jgi:hypothetical protein
MNLLIKIEEIVFLKKKIILAVFGEHKKNY